MAAGSGPAPLRLRKLRDLDLAQPVAAGRPAFLSAASGLVQAGGEWLVVADDELHLGCFAAVGNEPGRLLRLFAGELPAEPRARKASKPDLEILLRLPALPAWPQGALLALGSGSGAQRRRGALLVLDGNGRAGNVICTVDAALLYEQLERQFRELNLEGGWIDGNKLYLLQRGHRGGAANVLVELDATPMLAALAAGAALPPLVPHRLLQLDLGEVDGVPLTFTDACGLPDGGWLFSAVAEDTDNAYADGSLRAAAIGLMTQEGQLRWQVPLDPVHKVEGIHARPCGARLDLWCVTDADDARIPAQLLHASLEP